MSQRSSYTSPRLQASFFFAVIILATSCGQSATTAESNNYAYFAAVDSGVQNGGSRVIPIETPKGVFKVWTKRIGNNPKIKVLLLTGGPGASHEYAECFESFFPKEGIEFYYYDQLTTGFSDNPKDSSLFNLDRYVEEVEQVRKALGLTSDNFYVWGHSWGGILAMQYALKYQGNMKALIISNMMSSTVDYNNYAKDVLARQLDPKVLDSIRDIEKRGDYKSPKYMELLMPNFYAKHICRIPLDKWPEPVLRSFSKMNEDLYVAMQGPSEFGLSGKLTGWDVKAELPKLTIPVLTIGGQFDTMDPGHMKWMSTQVQNGSYLLCPNGSHMSCYDDQQIYMTGLIKFIKAVDGGGKKALL